MIVGIGCDIVEHNLTTNVLNWESDENTLRRVFSRKEFALYTIKKNIRFICGRFAGKEAVLKCLVMAMQDGISLSDIQILQLENGKPVIRLCGEVKKIAEQMGINSWHISITHSTSLSYAFVIAEDTRR
jgi:holo-[acyl-carrier protein] synthase